MNTADEQQKRISTFSTQVGPHCLQTLLTLLTITHQLWAPSSLIFLYHDLYTAKVSYVLFLCKYTSHIISSFPSEEILSPSRSTAIFCLLFGSLQCLILIIYKSSVLMTQKLENAIYTERKRNWSILCLEEMLCPRDLVVAINTDF